MAVRDGLTRRALLRIGFGTVAGAASGLLLARPLDDGTCITPAQPEGPFYPVRDQVDKDLDLTRIEGQEGRADGAIIELSGQVLDQHCEPVPGALVDVWQANSKGRYRHQLDPNTAPLDPNFQGWGQVRADAQGRYRFRSVIPGAYPAHETWWRPPHIHFKVSRPGYRELTTQLYFAGHPLNDSDRLLLSLPEFDRPKLVVEFTEPAAGVRSGEFNLVLRRS